MAGFVSHMRHYMCIVCCVLEQDILLYAGFQVGPTIPTFSYFFVVVLLFLENALLSLLFTVKCHFCEEILKIIPLPLEINKSIHIFCEFAGN